MPCRSESSRNASQRGLPRCGDRVGGHPPRSGVRSVRSPAVRDCPSPAPFPTPRLSPPQVVTEMLWTCAQPPIPHLCDPALAVKRSRRLRQYACCRGRERLLIRFTRSARRASTSVCSNAEHASRSRIAVPRRIAERVPRCKGGGTSRCGRSVAPLLVPPRAPTESCIGLR
jgi:hypothetical protein